MGGVDEPEVLEEAVEEDISDEELAEAVKAHLTLERPALKALEVRGNPLAVRMSSPQTQSPLMRGATVGVRVATNAIRNRIIATIAVMAVVAGPVWVGAARYHGVSKDYQEVRIIELVEERDDLLERVEELEEERIECLIERARGNDGGE